MSFDLDTELAVARMLVRRSVDDAAYKALKGVARDAAVAKLYIRFTYGISVFSAGLEDMKEAMSQATIALGRLCTQIERHDE